MIYRSVKISEEILNGLHGGENHFTVSSKGERDALSLYVLKNHAEKHDAKELVVPVVVDALDQAKTWDDIIHKAWLMDQARLDIEVYKTKLLEDYIIIKK